MLPQVHIQGMSTFTSPPTPKAKDTIDQLQMANQPSPSRSHVSTKDVSEKLQLENIYVRKLDVGKSPEPLKVDKPSEPIKTSGKPKVLKVDKAVNVPSLSGEPSNLNDFVLIGNKSQTVENSKAEEMKSSETIGNGQLADENVANPPIEVPDADNKNKKNRTVRFADEQDKEADNHPKQDSSNDPKFFLTEDNDDVTVDHSAEVLKSSTNEITASPPSEEGMTQNEDGEGTSENVSAVNKDRDVDMMEGDIDYDKNSLSVNISENPLPEDGAVTEENSSRLSMTDQGTDAAFNDLDNESVVMETPRDDQPIIAVDIAPKISDSNVKK